MRVINWTFLFIGRGISNEMINLFEIGYALENNNNLSTEIISNSFDKDLVVKWSYQKKKVTSYMIFNTKLFFLYILFQEEFRFWS